MSEPITRNLRDGVLTLSDGAAASVALALDSGDLKIAWPKETKLILDRGTKSHRRTGDDQLPEVSFSAKFCRFLRVGGANITPFEFCRQVGAGSALTTTNDDGGDVFTIDAQFMIVAPDTGEPNEFVELLKLDVNQIEFQEGDESNTISFTGQPWTAIAHVSSTAGA